VTDVSTIQELVINAYKTIFHTLFYIRYKTYTTRQCSTLTDVVLLA